MPLFVFGLRLFTLFLNVYDSYKILKLPPPSSRNNGLPSQRALMQRKRDMKGVLAVWIVWCCLVMYERFVESLVSIFVPFYDEVKSIFLLFLIMTRARGAEPIFLHVIRPFLSPYTPTLDLLLDFIHMLGDMGFAAIMGPFSAVGGLWATPDSDSDGESSGRTTPVEGPPDAAQGSFHPNGDARHPNGALKEAQSSSSTLLNRQRNVSSESAKTSSSNPQTRTYEIWHPPQSAHSDSEDTLHDDSAPTEITFMTEEAKEANEWRQYPSFPSAYPATPAFVQRKGLPKNNSSATPASLMGVLASAERPDSGAENVPESPSHEHSFNEDLLRSPGARGLFSEDEISEGEYDEDDEDVFNTTLRTPPPARPRNLGPTSSQPQNRLSIGSILANGGIKPRSSNASLHSRNGFSADSLTAPGLHKRQSSISSISSGRSVRSNQSIPKALRTGPLLKQADGGNSEDDDDGDDSQSASANSKDKSTVRAGQAARSNQPKTMRSTSSLSKTQQVKSASGPTRKPSRPLSEASGRSAIGAASADKTRPVTQRRNTPLTQATNR